jgi:hypothetical protein
VRCWAMVLAVSGLATSLPGQTRTLRIVTYNIEADVNTTAPMPGLIAPGGDPTNIKAGGVLEGIGEEMAGNDGAQPLDILALEETTSNPLTVTPIVNGLNAFYGVAGMYANSTFQAGESGNTLTNGNGPNALVYNTRTVQLLASSPVDPPGGKSKLGSASGEYREVMRYEFAPAGVTASLANEFYIYVSHYKSGTGITNEQDRLGEAQIIRNDEANSLSAGARVLYVGDYNVESSDEPMYQTILSNAAPEGVARGQGFDPLNLSNDTNIIWSTSTTDAGILAMLTEHGYDLEFRDDLQAMTSNVCYGVPGGLAYVPGTYHAFGNSGNTPYGGSVDSGGNPALANRLATNGPVFIGAAQLYLDLTEASDHLPVVADYTVPMPAPAITRLQVSGPNLVFVVNNAVTNAVYTLLGSGDDGQAVSNWNVVATRTAPSGSFLWTVTNGWNSAASGQFYLLREQ